MQVYQLFAKVLDYPTVESLAAIRDLIAQLPHECAETAALLGALYSASERMTLGELEELYTRTFDMRPDCTTNPGYHLFGDDVRRNLFMAQLKERLKARRIAIGSELPDHLGLVLQLLAAETSEDEAQALIVDCLRPAISRMLQTFDPSAQDNPYAKALRGLLLQLAKDARSETATVAAAP